MGDKNDTCPRCENQPYYDGHEPWCDQIKIDELTELKTEVEDLRTRLSSI